MYDEENIALALWYKQYFHNSDSGQVERTAKLAGMSFLNKKKVD